MVLLDSRTSIRCEEVQLQKAIVGMLWSQNIRMDHNYMLMMRIYICYTIQRNDT